MLRFFLTGEEVRIDVLLKVLGGDLFFDIEDFPN